MNLLIRSALLALCAAASIFIAGPASAQDASPDPASPGAAQPPPPAAEGYAPPLAPPPADDEPAAAPPAEGDGDGDRGSRMTLGIVGISVGAAGIIAGIVLLAVGADRKDEAKEIVKGTEENDHEDGIKAKLPGTNQCGDWPAEAAKLRSPEVEALCDDLESTANEGTVMTTAGYLLFVGGATLALASALYIAVGGGGHAAEVMGVKLVPTVGPTQWGLAAGGRF